MQKGEKGNIARDVAIYLSREMTGESGVDLGRHFGISGAGVTVRHGIIAEKIKKIRDRLTIIEFEICYFANSAILPIHGDLAVTISLDQPTVSVM